MDAMKTASGALIIDFSFDTDHNRSVVTMLGRPEDVRASMLAGAEEAVRSIDLNIHSGGHPRIGAVDVIPIVPVAGADMSDAVELSRQIGSDLSGVIGVPVFFYEESACSAYRKNLADVRKGGFEALKGMQLNGKKAPDMGPHRIHPTAGAAAVGARGPLVAFNVNLATDDISVAKKIAANIRGIRNTGQGMHGVKAIGVYLESRGIAQVSMNITRPYLVGMRDVFVYIRTMAHEMGVAVLESELIGAIRENMLPPNAEQTLQLASIPKEKIIEYWLPKLQADD